MNKPIIRHADYQWGAVAQAIVTVLLMNGCTTATDRRGFREPSEFAGMLNPNEQTLTACDRTEVTLQAIDLLPGSTEITRNSSATFHMNITKQPLLVRIYAEVWHQGTDDKPGVVVNGVAASAMEFEWPSLRERNYVTFLWDRGAEVGYAYDYQGWLRGTAFIDGHLLKVGDNTIAVTVTTDQIKLRAVKAEVLFAFDEYDTIYDLRRRSLAKPIPMQNTD